MFIIKFVLYSGLMNVVTSTTNETMTTLTTTSSDGGDNVTYDVTNQTTVETTPEYTTQSTVATSGSTLSSCVIKQVMEDSDNDTGYIAGIVGALFVGIIVGILTMYVKRRFCRTTALDMHNMSRCNCLKSKYETKDPESVDSKQNTKTDTVAMDEKTVNTKVYTRTKKSAEKSELDTHKGIDDPVSEGDCVYEQCTSEDYQRAPQPNNSQSLYANTGGEESDMTGEERYEPVPTQTERPVSHLYDPLHAGEEDIYVNTNEDIR